MSTSNIHKSVRNYLVNELDISKEYIHDYVDKRLDGFIQQYIVENCHSHKIKQTIAETVFQNIERGFQNGNYGRTDFETVVIAIIRSEVAARVKDLIKVSLVIKSDLIDESQAKKLVDADSQVLNKPKPRKKV